MKTMKIVGVGKPVYVRTEKGSVVLLPRMIADVPENEAKIVIGPLPLRVPACLRQEGVDAARRRGLRSGAALGSAPDSRVRVGWQKLFADGTLGSRTAAMREPFEAEAGRILPNDGYGVWVTPPDELVSANSLNVLSQRVMGVIGPMLGASLVAAGGPPLAFGLDALSFFISSVCVFPIRRAGLDVLPGKAGAVGAVGEPASLKQTLRRGFGSDPALRAHV